MTLEGTFLSPSNPRGQVCYLTVFDPTELDITLFQESNRLVKLIVKIISSDGWIVSITRVLGVLILDAPAGLQLT